MSDNDQLQTFECPSATPKVVICSLDGSTPLPLEVPGFMHLIMRAMIMTAMLLCSCTSTSVGAKDGAQFRYIAREIFAELNRPSCSAPQGFDRHALLQAELSAMENFKRENDGTMAAQLLVIAQQDVTYEQKVERGCWADDDIRFAEMHVQMSKETVQEGLPKLAELAGELRGSEIEYLTSPRNRANFRYLAKRLIESSRQICPIATGERDNDILSGARQEIAGFRETLEKPFIQQFEIAEADFLYYQSVITPECGEPSNESTKKLASQALYEVSEQLAAVRKTMN